MNQEGNQEEDVPFIPLDNEMPEERMERRFVEYIDKNGFTSAEIHSAYENLMGFETESEVNPVLLEEMHRLEYDHFPMSRFPEIVEKRASVERVVPDYEHFVEELPVTFDEKHMLRSIVKKQRVGELEIFIGGKLVKKVRIKGNVGEQYQLALEFSNFLKRYADDAQQVKQKLEFQFTE